MVDGSMVSVTTSRVALTVEGTPAQIATIRSACALALMEWENDLTFEQKSVLKNIASTGGGVLDNERAGN